MSDLDYLTEVVAELRRKLDAQPTYQWATCVRKATQGNVNVRFDADLWRRDADDNDGIRAVSDKLLQTQVNPGDRVLVQIHQGNMQAIAATRTYEGRYIFPELPGSGPRTGTGSREAGKPGPPGPKGDTGPKDVIRLGRRRRPRVHIIEHDAAGRTVRDASSFTGCEDSLAPVLVLARARPG